MFRPTVRPRQYIRHHIQSCCLVSSVLMQFEFRPAVELCKWSEVYRIGCTGRYCTQYRNAGIFLTSIPQSFDPAICSFTYQWPSRPCCCICATLGTIASHSVAFPLKPTNLERECSSRKPAGLSLPDFGRVCAFSLLLGSQRPVAFPLAEPSVSRPATSFYSSLP